MEQKIQTDADILCDTEQLDKPYNKDEYISAIMKAHKTNTDYVKEEEHEYSFESRR